MAPYQLSAELQQSLNETIKSLLAALKDASELTVETYIFPIGDEATKKEDYKGQIVARTRFEIDGDTSAGLPAVVNEKGEITGGINKEILELHNQNLERALTYRTELLKSAQDLVKDLIDVLRSA